MRATSYNIPMRVGDTALYTGPGMLAGGRNSWLG
jgi:hypothetical protein